MTVTRPTVAPASLVDDVRDHLRPHDLAALDRSRLVRVGGLVAAVGVLLVLVVASIRLGSRDLPTATVLEALLRYDPALDEHLIVRTVRLPRTVLGLVVGAAMGAAGALMQGITRNPLADPGILGVNAGASLFVVIAIHVFGLTSLLGFVWFAFAGAAIASVVVHVLGSRGRGGATPVKLTLAGAAVGILVGSVTSVVLLLDRTTRETVRYWAVGSLAGRPAALALQILPFVAVGLVMALASGRVLNAVTLGDDVARGLGQHLGRARVFTATAVVLLCGAATAVAGPITFVGLLVPHVARITTGPDHRWIIPYSIVLGAALLLGADLVGRTIVSPAQLHAGFVTALIGGPVFVWLARRTTLAEL